MERCKREVSRTPFTWSRCQRDAVRDGFCKQHHPDSVRERRKKREASWDKRFAAEMRPSQQAAMGLELAQLILCTNDVPEGEVRAKARELLAL